uniref:PPM-type phosphatase domain-containing protein n=1 Tax=Steinernema glaseri TaxID=37863 RepID=A0A1I8AHJ6_9BILA
MSHSDHSAQLDISYSVRPFSAARRKYTTLPAVVVVVDHSPPPLVVGMNDKLRSLSLEARLHGNENKHIGSVGICGLRCLEDEAKERRGATGTCKVHDVKVDLDL